MPIVSAAVLKSYFETGDRPTEAQFIDLVDSTFSDEIGAQFVSAVRAGGTGFFEVTNASAGSMVAVGSAGKALVSAGTVGSARTVLEAGSAGESVFLAGTQASARTAIDVTAATTAKAGLIEIATTAEVQTGTDAERAITPAGATATFSKITVETEQATTSGTQFDFTGISSNAKRITVIFNSVSLSGTDNFLVQIGDSGGVETSGYVSTSNRLDQAGGSTGASSTSGFIVNQEVAGNAYSGTMEIVNISGNVWIASHKGKLATNLVVNGGGDKTLSGTLDRVRITRTGTDTFDNGAVNIFVE